jgi:hypothetical protein
MGFYGDELDITIYYMILLGFFLGFSRILWDFMVMN